MEIKFFEHIYYSSSKERVNYSNYKLVLGLSNPFVDPTHPPRLTKPTLKSHNLNLVTIGGNFRPPKSNFGGLVGGSLH